MSADKARMATVPPHPLAALLPPMAADEFAGLVADIQERGLLEPGVLYEGKLLDGTHRQRACVEAGVPFRASPWKPRNDNDSPTAFVLSKNLKRRHLDNTKQARTSSGYRTLDGSRVPDVRGLPQNEEGRMTLPPPIGLEATLDLLRRLAGPLSVDDRERIESELITGNARFCLSTARRYTEHGVDLDDLFAVAQAGLLTAIRRFNLARSSHFSQYAARCMRRDLLSLVQRQGGPVRAQKPIRGRRLQLATTIDIDHVPDSVTERMLGPADDDPAADAGLRVDAEKLGRLVDALPVREGVVVRLRFGLAGCAPHELAEIGALLGVSKQRTQAILNNALAKIRAALVPTTKKAA